MSRSNTFALPYTISRNLVTVPPPHPLGYKYLPPSLLSQATTSRTMTTLWGNGITTPTYLSSSRGSLLPPFVLLLSSTLSSSEGAIPRIRRRHTSLLHPSIYLSVIPAKIKENTPNTFLRDPLHLGHLIDQASSHLGRDVGWLRIFKLEDLFNYRNLGRGGVKATESDPIVRHQSCSNDIATPIHSTSHQRYLEER